MNVYDKSAKIYRNWKSEVAKSDGVAAVEFAILAPVVLLLLLAVIEIGSAIFYRFGVNSAVSAATSFVILSGKTSYERSYGEELVRQLMAEAKIEAAFVNINNSLIVSSSRDGDISVQNLSASSRDCYCPSRQEGEFTWGNSVSCSSPCSEGGSAGKYLHIYGQSRNFLFFGKFFPSGFSAEIDAVVRLD